MGYIFVSYSRKDSAFVDRLISELEKAGHEVWIDRTDIKSGEQWRRQIVAAIDDSDIFLAMLSPNSVTSDNVRRELDLAEEAKKRVIPIIIEPTSIPEEMRYQLVGLQWLDMSDDFGAGFSQLLAIVGPIPTPRPSPPETPPAQSAPRTWNNIIAIVIVTISAIVAVAILVGVALLLLIPDDDQSVSTPQGEITEAAMFTEEPVTPTPPDASSEETEDLEAVVETAVAATRQAEIDSVAANQTTPEPVDTPLPPPDTPTLNPTPIPSSEPSPTPIPDIGILIEDFERYTGNTDDVFVINRNAGNEGEIRFVGIPHAKEGLQAMAFEFDIRNSAPNHYIGFDREFPPQDWSNYTALCFWIESDGSNRSLVLQFGESKYKFWKQAHPLANGTGDYCISLNDQHQLNLRSAGYYGIYIEGPPTGQSVIYIDNVRLEK